ncbi:MAG: nucleotidyltransferase family protein, partial [Gemmatimonadota bacterium]
LALDWSRRSREAGEHHEVLQSAATGREVELHWRLLHPQSGYSAGAMEPWETARRRTDAGISHLALDPAVESVFLAVHAAHHFGFRLHWLADVAALSVRLEPETWERAVDLAGRWRVRRALLTAVEAAGLTFDVPLPAALGRAVRKAASHRTAAWMAARLRAGTLKDPPQLEAWPRRYLMLDSWRSRLRVTGTLAFAPTQEDRDLAGLPAWADPLTAVLRPVFIVKRALTRPKIRTDRSAWQHGDRAD